VQGKEERDGGPGIRTDIRRWSLASPICKLGIFSFRKEVLWINLSEEVSIDNATFHEYMLSSRW